MGVMNAIGSAAKSAGQNALGNAGSNLNGMLGNVSKAVLMFREKDGVEIEMTEAMNTMAASEISGMMKSASALAGNSKKLKEMKKTIQKNASLAKKTLGSSNGSEIQNPDGYKMLTVQFNPANIRITSRGGGMVPVTDFDAEGKSSGSKMTALDPYAEISFMIVFDDVNNADAFMFDKFVLSPTTVVKNVSALVSSSVGTEYTVRPQVEGFMGALRNKYHRVVLFQWGDMRYWGVLNSVQGKYTLFNTQGEPVRAEVSVTISTGTAESDGDLYTSYWQEQYTEILSALTRTKGDQTYGTTGGTAHGNMFNNLLNI